jgi:hypothetical protein
VRISGFPVRSRSAVPLRRRARRRGVPANGEIAVIHSGYPWCAECGWSALLFRGRTLNGLSRRCREVPSAVHPDSPENRPPGYPASADFNRRIPLFLFTLSMNRICSHSSFIRSAGNFQTLRVIADSEIIAFLRRECLSLDETRTASIPRTGRSTSSVPLRSSGGIKLGPGFRKHQPRRSRNRGEIARFCKVRGGRL